MSSKLLMSTSLKVGFIFCLLANSTSALAQSDGGVNPYQFGGRCASQGEWTNQALSSLQEISSILTSIKDDPKCRSMSERFQQALPQIRSQIDAIRTTQESVGTRPQNLMTDMMVLNDLNRQAGGSRNGLGVTLNTGQLLLEKSVQYAASAAENAVRMTPSTPSAQDRQAGIRAFVDLFAGQRNLSEVTRQGLTGFTSLVNAMAENRECVLNNPGAGQFFAASVQMLSSFASSGQSTLGTDLASSLSQLFQAFRDLRFSRIIAAGKENQLANSISCLIEITSENYCAARDARQLLSSNLNLQEVRTRSSNGGRSLYLADRRVQDGLRNTPLRGFFLLTQQMPLINEWVMNILIAVDPQIVTDGLFRNNVLDNVNNFYKTVNDLRARYNQKAETVRVNNDLQTQQNTVIQLLEELESALQGDMTQAVARENFFLQSMNPMAVVFYLVGMNLPREIDPRQTNTFDWKGWFRTKLSNNELPEFRDPIKLLDIIRDRLNEMIIRAQEASDRYYNRWAIPDRQLVLQRAQLGVNFNVFEILDEVHAYLGDLKGRLERIDQRQSAAGARRIVDMRIMGDVIDTRQRIQNIRTSLNTLRSLSETYATKTREYETMVRTFNTMEFENEARKSQARSVLIDTNIELRRMQSRLDQENVNFIAVLFREFNVQLSRTGFLLNRVSNFVQLDFQAMLRDQENAGSLMNDPRFEQSLNYVVNSTAFNYLMNMFRDNLATYRADLENGLLLNKRNLLMIERTFKDFFARRIAELRIQNQSPQAGHATIELDSYRRLMSDYLRPVPTEGRSALMRPVDVVTGAIGMAIASLVGSDRYRTGGLSPFPWNEVSIWNRETAIPSDTEFGSARTLMAQYCVQALAFNDLRGIWHTCVGSKLESPFAPPADAEAREAFEKYLNVDFQEQALRDFNRDRGANESGRICALREFYRRNYALYLTRNNTEGRSQESQQAVEFEADIQREAMEREDAARRALLQQQGQEQGPREQQAPNLQQN